MAAAAQLAGVSEALGYSSPSSSHQLLSASTSLYPLPVSIPPLPLPPRLLPLIYSEAGCQRAAAAAIVCL